MPISTAEWDRAAVEPAATPDPPTPVGDYDSETDLVLAFSARTTSSVHPSGKRTSASR